MPDKPVPAEEDPVRDVPVLVEEDAVPDVSILMEEGPVPDRPVPVEEDPAPGLPGQVDSKMKLLGEEAAGASHWLCLHHCVPSCGGSGLRSLAQLHSCIKDQRRREPYSKSNLLVIF